MTNELRESMMPAFDRLINSLSEVLKASNLAELNLWRLETLVMKLLAAFAVELLQILIELARGQGYEGSRHKCPQCGLMMFSTTPNDRCAPKNETRRSSRGLTARPPSPKLTITTKLLDTHFGLIYTS